jgi:hypothetical protein
MVIYLDSNKPGARLGKAPQVVFGELSVKIAGDSISTEALLQLL